MGELCIDGGQYGTSEKSTGVPVGVPVLGMGNLIDGKIVWDNLKHMPLRSDELAKYALAPGDLDESPLREEFAPADVAWVVEEVWADGVCDSRGGGGEL